jgi:hypothetical protein
MKMISNGKTVLDEDIPPGDTSKAPKDSFWSRINMSPNENCTKLRSGSFGESELVLASIKREMKVEKGLISQNYPERSHFK